MTEISTVEKRRREQGGYALLMAVFMVATMILLASAATTSVMTEGRREMEKEMVWRGQQYQRAIGLYRQKFGNYPTKVEDLTRLTNGVRFLRQAYTDPMNKEDGTWRFIYVSPTGQLIGSLRQSSLLQNALTSSVFTGASPIGGGFQPVSPFGSNGPAGSGPGVAGGAGLTGIGGTTGPGGAGLTGQQSGNPASTPNPLEAQPQALQGDVIGGSIAGVGSKIKQPSFRVYQGGDTYQLWEFVWTQNQNGVIPLPNPAGALPTGTSNQQPQQQPQQQQPDQQTNGANPPPATPQQP